MKFLLNLFCVCLSAAAFAGGWAFPDFSRRTALDADFHRYPANQPVELPLDLDRFCKAAGIEPSGLPEFALAAEVSGKSFPVPHTVGTVSPESRVLNLRFRMPERYDRLMLYFDGRGNMPSIPPSDNLLNGVLERESLRKWRASHPAVRMEHTGTGLLWRLTGTEQVRSGAFLFSERVVPLPAGLKPGLPVYLELDAVSCSAVLFPLLLSVDQLDAGGKRVGEKVFDQRWTTVQTVPGKPLILRQGGHLDPRAGSLRVQIGACRNNEPKRYNADGALIPDRSAVLPGLKIMRMEIRAGYRMSFPGANPALYTEGDVPGSSALKLGGHTAALYNNFPSTVWSESMTPRSQESWFWPLADGTLELRIRPEWERKTVVLAENTKNRRKPFLKLSYDPERKRLLLEMNDCAGKSLTQAVPCVLPSGKWHHLAVTWGAADGVGLFANGKRILKSGFKPAPFAIHRKDSAGKLAEYTAFGADCGRFHNALDRAGSMPFLKGALDSVRVSKKIRYREDFTPEKRLPVDSDTCAAFDYERNFDGVSGIGPRRISGSIYAADVPPRADVFTVEHRSGKTEVCRYAPERIPEDNMPQNLLCRTAYPVVPSAEDFHTARTDRRAGKRMKDGEVFKVSASAGSVMNWVEIACPPDGRPLSAPFLRKPGEVDPRSYGNIARSLDLSDCTTPHGKVRKAFDFMIRSTDYFTFQGAEFRKGENVPYTAESASLLAINSYACFECGPLNTIASGIFINSLGYPAVLTFGNAHLFQQVWLNGKPRVFDLSAQQYFPSRDMDDAASLEELETDIYLLARTRKPVDSASHFYRMGNRGVHTAMPLPPERLAYTLYPGESFRYYLASNGESNDLNVPGWRDKAMQLCEATWTDVRKETGADGRIGRVVQRPLPHTATGLFRYSGRVDAANGAFRMVNDRSFCYRIDSPYTIIRGTYRSGDPGAEFELSWNNGKDWRKLESRNGVCTITLPLRGRHAALLRVTTPDRRDFSAETVVQLNPRRLTGGIAAGENELRFSADSGEADVTVAWREPGRKIVLDGGFYFGTIPGLERQLFVLNPGESRSIRITGISAKAFVQSSGPLRAELKDGCLHLSVPETAGRQFARVTLSDGGARKFADVLIGSAIRGIPVSGLTGGKRLAAGADRPMETVQGKGMFSTAGLPAGEYVVLSLTRRDNRNPAYVQLYITAPDGKEWVGARIRNPGVDYYKAVYGGIYSRFRWDYATGRDSYPSRSNVPVLLKLSGGAGESVSFRCGSGECGGFLLIPAEDREFFWQVIRNLTSINRADHLFPIH